MCHSPLKTFLDPYLKPWDMFLKQIPLNLTIRTEETRVNLILSQRNLLLEERSRAKPDLNLTLPHKQVKALWIVAHLTSHTLKKTSTECNNKLILTNLEVWDLTLVVRIGKKLEWNKRPFKSSLKMSRLSINKVSAKRLWNLFKGLQSPKKKQQEKRLWNLQRTTSLNQK